MDASRRSSVALFTRFGILCVVFAYACLSCFYLLLNARRLADALFEAFATVDVLFRARLAISRALERRAAVRVFFLSVMLFAQCLHMRVWALSICFCAFKL